MFDFIWFIKSSPYNLAVSKWGPSNSTEMVDFDAKQRTILKGSWIPLLYADLYCIYMRSWQELESPIPSKHGMEKNLSDMSKNRCCYICYCFLIKLGWSCLRNCASFIYQYIIVHMSWNVCCCGMGKAKEDFTFSVRGRLSIVCWF